MTNETLQAKMWAILKLTNVFDRYEYLLAMEPEYKKSDFYKISKLDLFDAFNYFMQQTGIIVAIVNTLNSEDLSKITENFGLDKLLGNLKDKDRGFLESLIDLEGLKGATNQADKENK